jgi:membrane-associated phospholipid phosphatase
MIVWFYNKKISYWFWLIAILIGVARVYVGIHHVVDILGSIIIVIISGIIYFVLKKYKKIS